METTLKTTGKDTRKAMWRAGCSGALYTILNREFGHPMETEERASSALSGGPVRACHTFPAGANDRQQYLFNLLYAGQQRDRNHPGPSCYHKNSQAKKDFRSVRDIPRMLRKSARIEALKDRFNRELRDIHPHCIIQSPEQDCLPNTLSITFPEIINARMIALLDSHGIAVQVETLSPLQLDESMLFVDHIYILDIRPPYLRRKVKSLPNSHVTSLFSMKKYLDKIPRNRNILVVCENGNLSYMATYYLKLKRFPKVSSLLAGHNGWRKHFGELYQIYAGQNLTLM